ncbi:hypothetical protein [Actinomadura sp. SCN-SB]|uniref:hypothetical protein n=1 Tax=Actinomadura sp. SCN-SB TaxID=3373092 RepID=UPI003750E70A
MNQCMVTTGFFVLGRCGRTSVSACPQCRRLLCGEHQGAYGLCPECSAAQGYGANDPHDPRWVQSYRRGYYQRSSQTYSDPNWYSSFDSYDRGAFAPGNDYSSGSDYDYGDDSGLVDS